MHYNVRLLTSHPKPSFARAFVRQHIINIVAILKNIKTFNNYICCVTTTCIVIALLACNETLFSLPRDSRYDRD